MDGSGYLEDALTARDVFERFPFGILVLDEHGTVVAANPAAEELLGRPLDGAGDQRLRCCDLIGCRQLDGPLESACLAELVAQSRGPLPEIRVDLMSARVPLAVWITAAPLGDESSATIVQIRPGRPCDRRRRTEPHWTGAPELRIRALGTTRVESREGQIGGAWLDHRSGQLLKYLVCERGRAVPSEEIAEAIWPGIGPTALNSVRHAIFELRGVLEPTRPKRKPSSFIIARRGSYAIDETRIWIDASEFEEEIGAGLAAFREGAAADAVRRLEGGMRLYEGDLLSEDPYATWATLERARLRDLAGRALGILAELTQRDNDLETATDHLRKLAEMEPFDVHVHRELIAIYLRRGRRSEAMRRYSDLRTRMLRSFSEAPDFDLADLLDEPETQLRLM